MKALLDWIDDRTGLVSTLAACRDATVPGGARCRNAWPSMIVFTLVVQILTGLFLWMYYSPSAQTAWESVYFLQYEVAGGWLLRGLHHYSAQVLVALTGIYVIQMVLLGTYRPPREFVFWTALLMGLVSLALCLTGDLLAWDQGSYAATLVRTRFLMLLPGIGESLFRLAAGGPGFGHLTLTRFFALHVGVFTPIFLALTILLLRFLAKADFEETAFADRAGWYWPNQAVLNMAGCLVVLAAIGLLVARHALSGDHAGQPPGDYLGVALGAPADPDPANFYAAARPEWSMRGVYQFSNMFQGEHKIVPIFIIPGFLVTLMMAMPLVARFSRGHLLNVLFLLALLLAVAGLTIASYRHDHQSQDYQAALVDGLRHAERVKELANSPAGIPVGGALSLMRNDAKTQGPILFEQHCASCHPYRSQDGPAFGPEEPTAPELTGFGAKSWFAGLFDPHQVDGPKYFGGTKFRDGDMVDFVQSTLKELRDEDEVGEEALQKLIACLTAGALLDGPRQVDGEEVRGIDEETILLFEDFTCTDCHRFYHLGDLGDAPDLTDYGSRRWLIDIISDPSHERFYGSSNDRMPSYRKSPEEATLSARQVEMLADWLRGVWYRPGM
jgi:ubiquinol-cytochrome c reductase cytochrome b subunit